MAEHNTHEIRAAAHRMNRLSDQLRTIVSSLLAGIIGDAEPLRGDMAVSLQDKLETVSSNVTAVRRKVDQCSSMLFEYARQLDLADARAKAMIESK